MKYLFYLLELFGLLLALIDLSIPIIKKKLNYPFSKFRQKLHNRTPIQGYKDMDFKQKSRVFYGLFLYPLIMSAIMSWCTIIGIEESFNWASFLICFALTSILIFLLVLKLGRTKIIIRAYSNFIPEYTLSFIEKISYSNYVAFLGVLLALVCFIYNSWGIFS